MMAWLRLLLAVGAGLLPSTPSGPAAPVQPRTEPPRDFRLRLDPTEHRINVRVEFVAPGSTTVHLLFPGEWAGYPGLESRLRMVEAEGPSGTLAIEASPEDVSSGHRYVKVARPGRVTLSYSAVLTPPAESRLFHRVSQLSPDGGHLIGADLFPRIWLGHPRSGPQAARVQIQGLPAGWRVATVAERSGTGYVVPDLRSTVFFVGPLRIHPIDVGQRRLIAAIDGDWSVSDDGMAEAVRRIADALHGIAGDAWAAGTYLFGTGRVPRALAGPSLGGQVMGHSAITYLGRGVSADVEYDRWLTTAAHEMMHWYIPQAFDFGEKPPAWFAEGFTDYFALKALLASGLIDGPSFLRAMGERLTRYRKSPLYGHSTMAQAQTDFWEDDAYRYIYDGGAVAALLLDLGFQARGRSLEGILRAARRNDPLTLKALTDALAVVDQNDWLRAWIESGAAPDWDAELERYGLLWKDGELRSEDGWAVNVLGSIPP